MFFLGASGVVYSTLLYGDALRNVAGCSRLPLALGGQGCDCHYDGDACLGAFGGAGGVADDTTRLVESPTTDEPNERSMPAQ